MTYESQALAYDPRQLRLYVGGRFSRAGSVSALNIAFLDENTGTWATLPGLGSWLALF